MKTQPDHRVGVPVCVHAHQLTATIASADEDPERTERPRRWDIGFIHRFMIVFGLVSSVFDYLTFAVLIGLNANIGNFERLGSSNQSALQL